MASGVNGLITYSCAPAASARTIWLCSLSVVTIISVTPRHSGRPRTLVTNSSPFITGMFQSMQQIAGRLFSACACSITSSAAAPCSASSTSKPAPMRMRLRIDRMARESSITRARMRFLSGAALRREVETGSAIAVTRFRCSGSCTVPFGNGAASGR